MSDFLQAPHQPCHSREINKYNFKVTTRNLLCLQHYYFILGVRHPYSIVLHLHRIKKKWGCFSILTTVYNLIYERRIDGTSSQVLKSDRGGSEMLLFVATKIICVI